MKRKLLIVSIFWAFFCLLSLNAQTSNSYISTAGGIRTPVDEFMNVCYFNDSPFSKNLTYVNFSNEGLNFGMGIKSESGYLGTYYYGDLWNNIRNKKVTEVIDGITTVDKYKKIQNYNQFDILFGWKKIGFKMENLIRAREEATSTVSEKHNSYDYNFTCGGYPFLVWKMNIKPYLGLGFGITSHEKINKTAPWIISVENQEKHNSFNCKLGTDFEFGKNSSFYSVAGFSYGFKGDFYPDGPISVETTIDPSSKEELSSDTDIRNDKIYNTNSINTFYRFESSAFSKFKLGGIVNIDYNFINSKEGSVTEEFYNKKADKKRTEEASFNVTEFDFNLIPSFGLGLSCIFNPYFTWNFGYGGKLPAYNFIKKTEENKISEEQNTGKLEHHLCTGFVLNLSDNFLLDVAFDLKLINPSLEDLWKTNMNFGFSAKF